MWLLLQALALIGLVFVSLLLFAAGFAWFADALARYAAARHWL